MGLILLAFLAVMFGVFTVVLISIKGSDTLIVGFMIANAIYLTGSILVSKLDELKNKS